MPCNKPMTTMVPSGWDYKEITVHCGNTSPTGNPFLCPACERAEGHRNWRQEAEEAGERWDPLD